METTATDMSEGQQATPHSKTVTHNSTTEDPPECLPAPQTRPPSTKEVTITRQSSCRIQVAAAASLESQATERDGGRDIPIGTQPLKESHINTEPLHQIAPFSKMESVDSEATRVVAPNSGKGGTRTPASRGASYLMDQDGGIEAVKDGDIKRPYSPLITRELTLLTRELSMIARQGTTLNVNDRDPMTMATPLPQRDGLASRLSTLPQVSDEVPVLDLRYDPQSGVSMLLLSFIYQHSPSIKALNQQLSTQNTHDELLKLKIHQLLIDRKFVFPLDSGVGGESVKVQVVGCDRDNCLSRNTGVSSQSHKESGHIMKGEVSENGLPVVTPRGILLTPEPAEPHCQHDLGEKSPTVNRKSQHIKDQIMVCIKVYKDADSRFKNIDGDCCLETATIQDFYCEFEDRLGLDFFRCPDNVKQGSSIIDLDDAHQVYIITESDVWPQVARQWFDRQRFYWPRQDVVDKVRDTRCHVVGAFSVKPHQINTYLEQSSYTFPNVDEVLFSSLNHIQFLVFTVVSTLYNDHFKHPPLLHLSHIKAVFFSVCENTPPDFWKDTELASCVFHVLNQLLEAVTNLELPHYITAVNLLQDTDPVTAIEVAELIRNVRTTPMTSLINSTLFGPSDQGLFEPVLTYIARDRKDHNTTDTLACMIETALKAVDILGKTEPALILLDDTCTRIFQHRHFTQEAITMVRLTSDLYSDLCDLDKVMEYTENMAYIAYEYDSPYLDLSLNLCRLGTLYHCKALQKGHQEADLSQGHWLHKSLEYFELAIMEDFSLVSALHFAIYLMNQDRVMDAIVKLTDALALTDESDEAELFADTTTFTRLEVDILDRDLAMEVRVMGKVETPTIAMAYYQLCRALLSADLDKGLDEYIYILEVLSCCQDNSHPHATWVLLGYVKRCKNDLSGARRAFHKATYLHKEYKRLKPHLETKGRSPSTCCHLL